jgi:hypothetical protein
MKQRTIFIVHVVVIMKQDYFYCPCGSNHETGETIFIVHVAVIMKQGVLFLLSMW